MRVYQKGSIPADGARGIWNPVIGKNSRKEIRRAWKTNGDSWESVTQPRIRRTKCHMREERRDKERHKSDRVSSPIKQKILSIRPR